MVPDVHVRCGRSHAGSQWDAGNCSRNARKIDRTYAVVRSHRVVIRRPIAFPPQVVNRGPRFPVAVFEEHGLEMPQDIVGLSSVIP